VDRRTHRVSTVAGTGQLGYSGDGGPATHAQIIASDVAFDRFDNMYIADAGNNRIRRVDHRSGTVTTVVGSGIAGAGLQSGPAADAGFLYFISIAFDPSGAPYFSDDALDTVRRLDIRGILFTTVAGVYTADPFLPGRPTYNGDGIPATQAYLSFPSHIAVDCAGDLTISDTFNYRVRQVDARTGIISTIAGTGTAGYSGDGGLAIQASLQGPRGLGYAPDGSLYIADGPTIRRVAGFTGTRNWDCRDERRFHRGDGRTW
jgi:hypothetical protein